MSQIIVEKNVPFPKDRKSSNNYPYKQMEIGDSFFIDEASIRSVCNLNYRMSKMLGMRFIGRKEGIGVRVWRIE